MIWQIRIATPDDSGGLKICMESAYATYQKRMGGERLPPMDVDYSTEIEKYPCWIVESGKSCEWQGKYPINRLPKNRTRIIDTREPALHTGPTPRINYR